MSKKKYVVVRLTEEERAHLRTLIGRGTAPARTLSRARILLLNEGQPQGEGGAARADAAILEALEVGLSTVARVRQRYVNEGLEAALTHKAPDREYPGASSTGSRKPAWSLLRAASRPAGASTGP